MNTIKQDQLAQFNRWVQEDWPKDPMQQEIHLIRLIRQEEMKGMTDQEIVAYYNRVALPSSRDAA